MPKTITYVNPDAARKRVFRLFPPARNFKCVDCGRPAREYDHYAGYGENWNKVDPVCRSCHLKRGLKRGEIPKLPSGNRRGPFIGPRTKRHGTLSEAAKFSRLNRLQNGLS